MNATLKKLSVEQFNQKYYNNIGIRSDDFYEIELRSPKGYAVIGIVMVSNTNPHYDYKCTFIEWVEIIMEFRGNSFFSNVIEELFNLYNTDEIHFESDEKSLPIYHHIGATVKGVSSLTENTMMVLNKVDFDKRIKRIREIGEND